MTAHFPGLKEAELSYR